MVPARRKFAEDRFDDLADPRVAAATAVPGTGAGASTAPSVDWGYDPGGQVGALHAEIARRLHAAGVEPMPAPAGSRYESIVRSLSVVAGYGTLAAGYGVVALAGYYWAGF